MTLLFHTDRRYCLAVGVHEDDDEGASCEERAANWILGVASQQPGR